MFDYVTDIYTNREKNPRKNQKRDLKETPQILKLWKRMTPIEFFNQMTLFLKI